MTLQVTILPVFFFKFFFGWFFFGTTFSHFCFSKNPQDLVARYGMPIWAWPKVRFFFVCLLLDLLVDFFRQKIGVLQKKQKSPRQVLIQQGTKRVGKGETFTPPQKNCWMLKNGWVYQKESPFPPSLSLNNPLIRLYFLGRGWHLGGLRFP